MGVSMHIALHNHADRCPDTSHAAGTSSCMRCCASDDLSSMYSRSTSCRAVTCRHAHAHTHHTYTFTRTHHTGASGRRPAHLAGHSQNTLQPRSAHDHDSLCANHVACNHRMSRVTRALRNSTPRHPTPTDLGLRRRLGRLSNLLLRRRLARKHRPLAQLQRALQLLQLLLWYF